MRRKIYLFIFCFILCVAAFFILNIEVSTRQGINYKVSEIKIPLYLKILDFIDRHYNYEQLVKRITKDEHNNKEKVLKIFSWTYNNIRKQPESLPAVDDHAWHIIVRGYGANDQSSDVFATLCNYAGCDAYYMYINSDDRLSKIILAFVKIEKNWYVFDPYNGVYFKDKTGGLADVPSVKNGKYQLEYFDATKIDNLNYENYIRNLPDKYEVVLKRENIQSPLRRFLYGLKGATTGHKNKDARP